MEFSLMLNIFKCVPLMVTDFSKCYLLHLQSFYCECQIFNVATWYNIFGLVQDVTFLCLFCKEFVSFPFHFITQRYKEEEMVPHRIFVLTLMCSWNTCSHDYNIKFVIIWTRSCPLCLSASTSFCKNSVSAMRRKQQTMHSVFYRKHFRQISNLRIYVIKLRQ